MTSPRVRAVFGIAGVVMLSKVLGLIREMVIAAKFGTTANYDLYLIAIMLPALVYGVINFASFYLFVPYLTRKFESPGSQSEPEGWKATWSLFNFSIASAVFLTVAIILAAPYLMRIWAGEFTAVEFSRIVLYSRFTALIVILGTSEAFLRAFLNVQKVFTYPAAGPMVFNFFSILCIILFYRHFGVGAIAIGLVAGLALQNVYLLMRLAGYRPFAHYTGKFFGDEVKSLLATAGVLLLIELLNRSYFLIDRYYAPDFGAGIVSALNYSQVLVLLPDAVVGFAIASVVFPMFSKTYEESDRESFAALYQRAITAGVLVAVPLAVYFFLNARDIVYLVFFRGVFNAESVAITTNVLLPYTPTIIALFVVSTSIRACYGRGWSKVVLLFTVILLATKFIGTALLPRWFGYPGISAATTISQVSFAAALLVLIVKRSEMKAYRHFVIQLLKLFVAGAVAWGVLYFARYLFVETTAEMTRIDAVVRLVVSGVVLFGCYGAFVYLAGFGGFIGAVFRRKAREA